MKLLLVDCCISQRGENSRTAALAKAYLEGFRSAHPNAEVETVTPETLLNLRPFDVPALNERDALASVGAWDAPVFDLAWQFRRADRIVVAAPFWDLSYPAALRTYVEYISANGLTYHYDAAGCHGDCAADTLVYLTTGGDVEREESVGVVHWRQLAAMFGIPSARCLSAQELDIQGNDQEAILREAQERAAQLVNLI